MMKTNEVIAELLECDADELDHSSALGLTPQWDSLAHVKIMLYLEQNYAIEINESTMNQFKTYSAIFNLIEQDG